MKNRIGKKIKPRVKKGKLTVAEMERNYRATQRAKGIKYSIIPLNKISKKSLSKITKYCLLRQISLSEYVAELVLREKSRLLVEVAK